MKVGPEIARIPVLIDVTHRANHWFPRFLGVAAVTIRRTVYFAGLPNRALESHEHTHVAQWTRFGTVGFLARWWWYQAVWRDRNPLELQARVAEARAAGHTRR